MGISALVIDDIVMEAKRYSVTVMDDVYNYSIIGCVEPKIGGKEYSDTEGMRINWAKILELCMFDGRCPVTGEKWNLKYRHSLEDFENFVDFYTWYKEELVNAINVLCNFIKIADRQYGKY